MTDAPTPPTGRDDASRQAKMAQRPFWKTWWFILACIIVVALAAAAAAAIGGDIDTGALPGDTSSDTTDDQGDSTDGGFGSPAADGEFTFTVNSFECGEDSVGEGPFAVEAGGEYCIAEATVENTGDGSQVLNIRSQYLYVGDERYSPDPDAIFADERAEALFIEEIGAGLSVDGVIVWDVPEGSDPDRLELHESPFSDGVEVSL